ncbi:lipocalin family protein [Echinicola sp. CAU 1574]|uniref:Lipocalin family protein n=1 Tax=Echinicola arenosa TaxID=2774144 RepID=A0ABR9AJT4_9BACT|nr:lipocalin family protein [Echinicola arenosa]MBD8489073.1 lipocalin family protein [Echinicola arenosa]
MKLLRFTFILMLASLMFSCSDTELPMINHSVVGEWEMVAMTYSGTSTVSYDGINFPSTFSEGIASDIDYILTVNESPNTLVGEGSYTVALKGSYMDQEFDFPVPVDYFMKSGSWEVEGDKFIITKPGESPETATIVKLTADEMVLKVSTDLY